MTPNFDWNKYELADEEEEPQQQQPEFDWNKYELAEEEQPQEKPQQNPLGDRFDSRIEHFRKNGVSEEDIQEYLHDNPELEFEGSWQALKELPRGALSGATAGYSELLGDYFKPKGFAGEANKVVGSLAPIGGLHKLLSTPLKAAASKSPIIAKGLTSFADLLGLSAAGGVYGALEESSKATAEEGKFVPPTLDAVLDHGATWAALDAGLKALGWTGRFGKALIEKAVKSGKPAEKVLEEISSKVTGDKVAEKAISILEGKSLKQVENEASRKLPVEEGGSLFFAPNEETKKAGEYANLEFGTRPEQKGIDLRNKKISRKDFSKLESGEAAIPIPYNPVEIKFEQIAEESLTAETDKLIESISPRAASEKELGENVQKGIEKEVAEHKKSTDKLYEIAEEVGETKPGYKQTADAIVEEIKNIEAGGMNLSPEGYKKARTQLMDALTDLGYGVETDANGLITRAVESNPQNLSRGVNVKKRFNNIINYDLVDTGAQDFLKKPAAALRGEIRAGYGPKDSTARKAFEKAEKEFGEFAEKKGKKSIRNLRSSEKPETVAKIIRTPSGLADIKQVVSKEQFAQIEREILEHLKGLNEEKTIRLYRELRQSLTPESRSVAEQIIESKAAPSSPLRRDIQKENLKRKVIDDLSEATLTGGRPKAALDLWKTKEGQSLIKEALNGSPNKAEILKYLEDQSFKDFASSVVKPDGEINFKTLNEMLKDPATAENIRLVAGQEGVNFLKNLEKISQRISKNESILERTISKGSASERKKIKDELDKLGKQRFEQIKNKLTDKTPSEKIFQDKFNKDAIKDREELQESLRKKGNERFRKSKEKRAEYTKQEQLAMEAQEKATILFKIDDLVSSYGVKGKAVLTALGVLKFGTGTGLALPVAYEVVMRLAKNKTLQDVLKKAAITPKDHTLILRALTEIEKVSE